MILSNVRQFYRKLYLKNRYTYRLLSTSINIDKLPDSFDAPAGTLLNLNDKFIQPYRVVFGIKKASESLGAIAKSIGIHKALVVRGNDPEAASRTQYIEFLLLQAGIPCFQYTLQSDCATFDSIDNGINVAQRVGADGIIAFGGGNVMDMAKALAAVLSKGGSADSYSSAAGSSNINLDSIPLVLLPSIPCAGAEISAQALVLDEDAEHKRLFINTPLPANAVIIDPLLAISAPLVPTIHGAVTALGNCIETYLAPNSSAFTQAIAMEGISTIAGVFAQPLVNGSIQLKDTTLRKELALGSLYSGIATNSCPDNVPISSAIAIGMNGVSELPHSLIASIMLPYVLDTFEMIAVENSGDSGDFDVLAMKLQQINTELANASGFKGENAAAWIRYVSNRFNLPGPDALDFGDESNLGKSSDKYIQDVITRTMLRLHETRPHLNVSSESVVLEQTYGGGLLEKEDIEAIVNNAFLTTNA